MRNVLRNIYWNWVNILIGVIGGLLLSNLLSASGLNMVLPSVIVVSLLVIVLLIIVVYRFGIRREYFKPTVAVDERVKTVIDKSARNGFLVTYLTLFAILFYTEVSDMRFILDTKLLIVVIAVNLFVYILSFLFYYYRRA